MCLRVLPGICRIVPSWGSWRGLRRTVPLTLATLLIAGCGGSISRETYQSIAADLVAAGKLRTERAPADAPFTAADLTRTFQEIAFSFEFHFKDGKIVDERLEKPLHRWQGEIRYKIIGDAATAEDAAEVKRLTREIAGLTGLTFREVTGSHDMLISIASPGGAEEVSSYLGGRDMPVYQRRYNIWRDTPQWICGATLSGATDGSHRLVYAHVFLSSEVKGILRRSCLHEEIAQSLGLTNDHPKARPSVFNDDQEFAFLTDHDAALLSMLYDPQLRSGMSEAEAMPIVRRRMAGHMQGRRFASAQ
ncbi:MAG: DUF2927 domain-containing protein [Pseudomonadota bacterium]